MNFGLAIDRGWHRTNSIFLLHTVHMNVFKLLVFINKVGFQLKSNLGQRPIVANDLKR